MDASERNDFQDFIQQSTGKNLPLFGANLFAGGGITFAPLDRVPVPADYVIGPGDEIRIQTWGQIDLDLPVIVDRNGQVNIPKVGAITVAGLRYSQLQNVLRASFSRIFRNFEMNVTLGQLRSVQIFVVGQAKRPGSFTVSSLSTLVNALFASGGPSAKGSMRGIQLKRAGAMVVEFDVYDLLMRGDLSKDRQVLPGDVIFIPSIGPLAAIHGGVRNEAIYELKGETRLKDLIDLAGGLTTTAAAQNVLLERITDRKTRRVEQVQFDAVGLSTRLQDGDLAQILNIQPAFENAVTLRGNVALPARFPWRPGMRIRDLIPHRDALIVPDYWIKRNAAVRTDIQSELDLRTSLKRGLPEINWNYAVIDRLNLNDITTTLIPFDLGKVVLEKDESQNMLLQPGDVVTIFSKNDIQVPIDQKNKYVRVQGEIGAPGVYQLERGETLRHLLARIGPLTKDAYLYGMELSRTSAQALQQARLDEAITRLGIEVERNAATLGASALSTEAVAGAQQQIGAQRLLIERLRQLKASGRIVLVLPPERPQLKDLPDLAMEDGDQITIPSRPSVVSVVGAVYNSNTYTHDPHKRVRDYLAQAGGIAKHGDDDNVFVLRADGSVVSDRQGGWLSSRVAGLELQPGDAIFIPEKLDKVFWTRELKDWTQIFYQFALGVAGLKVLKDL